MSRPRRSEQSREALIEAGMNQLAQYGYHGTGIKQILDEVKVPKGSFYNYFDSKEAFVAEIIEHYASQVFDELVRFVDSTRDQLTAMDQLKAIYAYMMNKYEALGFRQTCLIGSIAAEIGSSSERCQKAMSEAVNLWCQHITELVAEAQRDGDVRADLPPHELAHLIWSVWEGSLLRMKLEGSSESGRKVLRLLLDQLLPPV